MPGRQRAKGTSKGAVRRPLLSELRRRRPDVESPETAVAEGRVLVDGRVVTNPASMVAPSCALVVDPPKVLRGTVKLGAALDALGVTPLVDGATCLDVGACTGGFTIALLERGAARVFAVDVGHGQLLGSLRQDPRVVNLEATNVAQLSRARVPAPVDVIVVDVSFLPLRTAVSQLSPVAARAGTVLVGLVKPMFELALAEAPKDPDGPEVADAVARASTGIAEVGWRVEATLPSVVTGADGAVEAWVHATYAG